MSVYVDHLQPCQPNKTWRWYHSAHLFADTTEELHAFAARLALKRVWFQDEGYFPHYDLTSRKHTQAVNLGAVLLARKEAIAKWHEILRRNQRECDHLRCREMPGGGLKCLVCGAILYQ